MIQNSKCIKGYRIKSHLPLAPSFQVRSSEKILIMVYDSLVEQKYCIITIFIEFIPVSLFVHVMSELYAQVCL